MTDRILAIGQEIIGRLPSCGPNRRSFRSVTVATPRDSRFFHRKIGRLRENAFSWKQVGFLTAKEASGTLESDLAPPQKLLRWGRSLAASQGTGGVDLLPSGGFWAEERGSAVFPDVYR
jgi:hypothetical protein